MDGSTHQDEYARELMVLIDGHGASHVTGDGRGRAGQASSSVPTAVRGRAPTFDLGLSAGAHAARADF